jgi:nucleoside-diphosphate-sugar epimerase
VGWRSFNSAEVVFHLVANLEVRHNVRGTLDYHYYYQNVTATMHVSEAAQEHSVGLAMLLRAHSLGDPKKNPDSGWPALRPISVYGAIKAVAEIM